MLRAQAGSLRKRSMNWSTSSIALHKWRKPIEQTAISPRQKRWILRGIWTTCLLASIGLLVPWLDLDQDMDPEREPDMDPGREPGMDPEREPDMDPKREPDMVLDQDVQFVS